MILSCSIQFDIILSVVASLKNTVSPTCIYVHQMGTLHCSETYVRPARIDRNLPYIQIVIVLLLLLLYFFVLEHFEVQMWLNTSYCIYTRYIRTIVIVMKNQIRHQNHLSVEEITGQQLFLSIIHILHRVPTSNKNCCSIQNEDILQGLSLMAFSTFVALLNLCVNPKLSSKINK